MSERDANDDGARVPAGPNLSALDEALRRRIDVAVARGATWRAIEHPKHALLWETPGDWRFAFGLFDQRGTRLAWLRTGGTLLFDNHALPDPENDPAAAWELATSERIAVVPAPRGWFLAVVQRKPPRFWGEEDEPARDVGAPVRGEMQVRGIIIQADSPGRAVVDAFLAKRASKGDANA